MAMIEPRKNQDGTTSYRAKIRMKGYRPEQATFPRKKDAQHWATQTEAAMLEGRYFKSAEKRKLTVAEAVDRYLDEVLPLKSAIMQEKQKFQFLSWKERIGYMLLCDLTPQVLSTQREELAKTPLSNGKPRSAASVNRHLAALSHLLTIACEDWGLLEDNPLLKVKRRTEPRGRTRFLAEAEVKQLLDACKKSDYADLYCLVVLALSTGARRAELMNLAWRDVDLKRQCLQFNQTKNGEIRRVPLKGNALKLLKEKSQVRRIDSNLVFPGKNGTPYTINKPWKKALKEAGVENFTFHDLRHTAASYLAMNGASLLEIANILGHKTLQMVQRYAHLTEDHTASVVEKMNGTLFS